MSKKVRNTSPAEPTPPVNILAGFESPVGIIRNVRAVLALLSVISLDEEGFMPSGFNMGYWLILQSITNALHHAEKLLTTQDAEVAP